MRTLITHFFTWRARSDHTILVGFLQNPSQALPILRRLRRMGFRCSAALLKARDGRIAVANNSATPVFGGLLGGLLGAAFGFVTGLISQPLILAILIGLVLGGAIARLDIGLDQRMLAKFRRWLLRGEAVVIVQAPRNRIHTALTALRRPGDETVTFSLYGEAMGAFEPEGDPPATVPPERLSVHAARLASDITVGRRGDKRRTLLRRLHRIDRRLDSIRRFLAGAVQMEEALTSGAEWFLDNAYLIRGQIGEILRNLPAAYYDQLPAIEEGHPAGLPRVYAAAAELIHRADGRLDSESITAFLASFQSVAPLNLGELWAFPLMLRYALVERLKQLGLRVCQRQQEQQAADFWANRLLATARLHPEELLSLLAMLTSEIPEPTVHFAVRLMGHLQHEAAAPAPLQGWLEHKLDISLAEALQSEHHRQAADQVSIANAVNSLRFLTRLRWRDILAEVSTVEAVLRQDPAGVYGNMDEQTRGQYRQAVEEIARWAELPEPAVAKRVVEMSRADASHVGRFLLGGDRSRLERDLGARVPAPYRAARWVRSHPAAVYLAAVFGITAAALGIVAHLYAARPLRSPWLYLPPLLLGFMPAWELAVQLANRAVMRLFPPSALPRMSYEKGIPDSCRTLVAVPMILTTPAAAADEIARLEVRYLANQDPALCFALLADFPDADAAETPADRDLLSAAVDGIGRLNEKYGPERFLLLHRPRTWSRSEGRWIGWERKRGKIEELNRLLNGEPSALAVRAGDPGALAGIRYVITLDSDTMLPRDTARQMIETISHPLNEPRLSADGRMVAEGYALIQPRVCTSLPSATATNFARLYADVSGSDPYCRVVSDVYQDLAGVGTFYGKGIYDPRLFHRILSGRFPEETVLSHDLLEGSYLRTGLASDLVLFDLFPRSYQTFTRRQHRWIRGDWQIAPWILPRVPTAGGGREANPLSIMDRWKIVDNLRRSLLPPALLFLLFAGWLLTPAPLLWTVLAGLVLFFPALLDLVFCLPRGFAAWRLWTRSAFKGMASAALLPHQAWLALDAVIRVWYRRSISHRHLLEWETAQASHERCHSRANEAGFAGRMALFALFGFLPALAMAAGGRSVLPAAAPFLLLWALQPLVIRLLGAGAPPRGASVPTVDDRRLFRETARQTWRFFDDFVGPDNHWLPPDNYQEMLHIEVARRTSPTNIGMWLLSALAAHDLGYLTPDRLAESTQATLDTLARMQKYRGHLLNWYDIATLEPLRPRYVSTVDSGNFLASLWAFGAACRQLPLEPILGERITDGLQDTAANLRRALARPPRFQPELAGLDALLAARPVGPGDLLGLLGEARGRVERLTARLAGENPRPDEPLYWAGRLEGEIRAWIAYIQTHLPWVERFSRLLPEIPDPGLREAIGRAMAEVSSLSSLAAADPSWAGTVRTYLEEHSASPLAVPLREGLADLERGRRAAGSLLARFEHLRTAIEELESAIDMDFLYDRERRLFAVGYVVDERRLDSSYYDLLASEARLASFVAIARNDVPNEHWAALTRPFTRIGGRPVLLSWNGTIFEYLMPLLLQKSYPGSLLDEAARSAVQVQIDYARRRGIPWGVSEAAFSALDRHRIYQYRAFGVPGLGLKRGLEEDLVVAPYATALALTVETGAAAANLRRLAAQGLRGPYGYYEAVDYTRQHCPAGERGVIVYAYMAHHQGMSLVALDNALNGGIMRARFHADPRVRAAEPLLFERLPDRLPDTPLPTGDGPPQRLAPLVSPLPSGRISSANTAIPKTLLLANGEFSTMLTNAGGGYTRWRQVDISRWRADITQDARGIFCYFRDLKEGTVWSSAYQPIGHGGRRYGVRFAVDRAEFRRHDAGVETMTEVAVAPDDPAEVRLMTLTNLTGQTRCLELTTYTELALAPHEADRAHPAFAKLFVETEFLPEPGALLARRRRRSPEEAEIWVGQILAVEDSAEAWQYETDRQRFLGRGRTARNPQALAEPLTNTAGSVLDPIFSLRCRVRLEPGRRLRAALVTVAGGTRQDVLSLLRKYREFPAIDNAFELAWTSAQLELRHLGIQVDEALHFQELSSHIIFPNPRLRPPIGRLRRGELGQERLWAHGISGDLPIVCAAIDDANQLDFLRELLLAHTYLHLKGLRFDLVVINGESAGYDRPLQEELTRIILAHSLYTGIDRPGGIFLRPADRMSEEDRNLLLAAANITLIAARGPLALQLAAPVETPECPPRLKAHRRPADDPSPPLPFMELPYFNGYGGFTGDGREYAIYLGPGMATPAPWANVMANPAFGALVTESGGGYAWAGNSQTSRLTPWANDPVADPVSIAVYLRDEDTGVYWSPTPAPIREEDAYRARHGQGYTVFEHNSHGIQGEMIVFVPAGQGAAGAEIRILRLRNASPRRRRLSVFAYVEWALGTDREQTTPYIFTKWDAQSQALVARNAYHPRFRRRVAFMALGPGGISYTGDRTEFIGRNGSLARPAALDRRHLSGRTGAGLDPCAAQQAMVDLEPEKTAEIVMVLGEAEDVAAARDLIQTYLDPYNAREALDRTRAFWDGILGAVEVRTPLLSVNLLLNRWLLYQTLSCRIWARSALYQSGGAYGFRDQLQDVTALLYAAPEVAREHILRAAGRQFVEGDVQHWWHPSTGEGTRTRCSDDLLWLVYATARYVEVTGDPGILEERIPYLDGRSLAPDEAEAYFRPSVSMEDGTLLEHCRRAIDKALTTGAHGLPLIGSGDWNDGLNRVGAGGRGESVWLGWFLIHVLADLACLCALKGEEEQARSYREKAHSLSSAIEAHAWDGDWYRRAYFDDGTPLGSRDNEEARLDSIAQSWGVIAATSPSERARRAVSAVLEHLLLRDERILPLFWPPFDRSEVDPGYVKAYPPGVRENGGQYTHAAVWLAMALARLGDGDRAVDVLLMLNPIERARNPAEVEIYRVEPYVTAADVYTHPDRIGQGGWTWYTGSSAWMYRVWLEEILGFKKRGDRLAIDPCIPAGWDEFAVIYRFGGTVYEIAVVNPERARKGVARVELDGAELPGKVIPLRDDGGRHEVKVVMGGATAG